MSPKLKALILKALAHVAPAAVRQEPFALRWTYFSAEFICRRFWVIPFLWDRERRQLVCPPGWARLWGQCGCGWVRLKWMLAMGPIVALAIVSVLLGLKNMFLDVGDGVSEKRGPERDDTMKSSELVLTIACSMFVTAAVHFFFNAEIFPVLINTLTQDYERLHREWMKTPEEDTFEDLLLASALPVSAFIMTVAFPVVRTFSFLRRCNLGLLSLLLPICEGEAHVSRLLMPFWVVSHWLVYTLVLEQMFFYIFLDAFLAVLKWRVVQELERPAGEARLKPEYRHLTHFLRAYRCLQISEKVVNEYLIVVAPIIFVQIVAYVVGISFYLIRGEFNPALRAVLSVRLLIMLSGLFLGSAGAGEVSSKLLRLKDTRAGESRAEGEYLQACYRACAPIKIYVGNFFVLTRRAPLNLLYMVVDTLVSLLCAIPAK